MRNKETRNRDAINRLERECDTLRLVVKHCLLQNGRQLSMKVADFEAADAEPNVLVVEDEPNDRMIVKFDGEEDLVIS